MILKGIDFGCVWNAAGARNFFGDGWPHHRWLGPLAPNFRGSTFVAKTTTLEPRAGNMPLRDLMPAERIPRCIKVNLRKAAVLNAVGLAGPGLDALLATGRWQAMTRPFVLSFMSVAGDRESRHTEARRFAERLATELPRFSTTRFAIEWNFSCPNVGLNPAGLIEEIGRTLDIVSGWLPYIPLIPKLNLLVSPDVAVEIGRHPECSAICVSNTIPWGSLPDRINWRGLFGETSPLAEFGGGGLSGAPLTPLVREWVASFMRLKPSVPLVAGGGVMSSYDALVLLGLGASAVELGSVAIVRPWRVAGIIRSVNRLQRKEYPCLNS